MSVNTIQTAAVIQSELDKAAVEQATSGWMEVNSSLVKYNGGSEVKIPELSMDGLADYDRQNGFVAGGVNFKYQTNAKQLTVVSTKSMTGHLLGGAGGIEAVFTALALRDQFAPPTIHYAQPDPECDLDYVPNTGRQQEMQYALSNSLGFGGHNACIALRRWEG